MDDTRSPRTLGQLKKWITRQMVEEALDEGKSDTDVRARIRKLWGKWEKQGLLATDPNVALLSPASILGISTLATASYNEARAEWEKRGRHKWGKRLMDMRKDTANFTTAVCKLMTQAGRFKADKEKEKTHYPQLSVSSAYGASPSGAAGMLPQQNLGQQTLPPPYAPIHSNNNLFISPPVTPIQADIQTPVQTATLTITGGQLEVENPNRDATQFLQETQSATMTDIIHRISDLEQKHRLEVAENPLVSSSQNLTPEH